MQKLLPILPGIPVYLLGMILWNPLVYFLGSPLPISTKTMTYVYAGRIDDISVDVTLQFDSSLACPKIKGWFYYATQPNHPIRVKGRCTYVICNDDYTRDEYGAYGDMIELTLFKRNKIMAQGKLCQNGQDMKKLNGWLYSTQRTYKLHLDLQEIRTQ